MMEIMDVVEYWPLPGVIGSIFAEGEDGGGIGDIDLGGGEGDAGVDLGDEGLDLGEGGAAGEIEQQEEKIDGRKGSKEFREALKAWEATPEGARFAKTARADHFRMQELATVEPGGISALRDKYALLESIGGAEGATQLQERVTKADASDEMLASGNVKLLDELGPDFDPGLAKLAPTILDRVMKSDPEAYAAAILPHLMSGLAGSAMVKDLNGMIDVLEAPHLDEAGKIKAITALLGKVGDWFAANEAKAGKLKAAPADRQQTELQQERTKFDQEQQTAHWNNKIAPTVASHERTKMEELYKPFDAKLKLDPAAKADLFATFKEKMKLAGNADKAYQDQMKIYRKQKNPDPATVANFVKATINRHAKAVVEGAVKARYGRFLGSAGRTVAAPVAGARSATPTGAGAPTVVSVKPPIDEIDYRKTSEADQWKGIYTLKSGKKVQVRKPA